MNAASTYVLGYVLSRVADEAPQEKDVADLFKNAWKAKNQWAKQLMRISGQRDVVSMLTC